MPKRGENIYKRRDGRWEGRYPKPDPVTGAAKYASVYGRSYTEVREKLWQQKQHYRQHNISSLTLNCRLTVRDALLDWLAERRTKIKLSSYARYQMLVQKQILPSLGDILLKDLTAKKLSAFIEQKMCRGRLDRQGGLSAKSIADILAVLKAAAKLTAKEYSLPNLNALLEVKAPVCRHRLIETFSDYEAKIITQTVLKSSTLSNMAILLSLNTGLRLGELCALRWEDIDFAEQTLIVRRNVQRINQNGKSELVIQTPKSEASKRVIPLTAEILLLLKKFYQGKAAAYVFGGSKPLEPRTMQYRFCSFLKKNHLKVRNFHSLRHSFATRYVAKGADVKSLSEILGHSHIKTTLQLYVHPSMEQKRANITVVSTLNDIQQIGA